VNGNLGIGKTDTIFKVANKSKEEIFATIEKIDETIKF